MTFNLTQAAAAIVSSLLVAAGVAVADHPQILVTPEDRGEIKAKIENQAWARQAVEQMKERVDPFLEKIEEEPDYLTSRLAMNWDTHYRRDLTAKSRWAGGEGRAPVPTPRFAGARNWATEWSRPRSIHDFKPYNDQDGKIWLLKDGEGAWVDPGQTGRTIEAINSDLMNLAADAGFLHYLTGDERYAKLAADLLWTYMEGFAHKVPPRVTDNDENSERIIGLTSFEVIHEDIITPMALAYDFVHDYMASKDEYDVKLIQQQFKRMIDRVIAGGFNEGNWNLNQARIIAYGGLALDENEAYRDGEGRPHYVDIVLNANLATQRGIARAIEADIDKESAMWPEAPGYGFGTVKDIVLMASLVGADERGEKLLADPLLARALVAQGEQLHPNGLSVGLGDTTQGGVNATALELLIAAARDRGDSETEQRLTAILQREFDAGRYSRDNLRDLTALTKYVAELEPTSGGVSTASPTFFGPPLDLLMMRAGDDPEHALSAGMYGTAGGHVHTNGVAIELYGAGYILGADPGRGSSYWEKDHGEYYSQPPAHNTVIVNGNSRYPAHGEGQQAMQFVAIEPQPQQPAMSDAVRFATVTFEYEQPISAEQQRTLALVRLDDERGFYFDVFRSRATGNSAGAGEFHDYLYHNIGQSLSIDASLSASSELHDESLMAGYRWLENVRLANLEDELHATFSAEIRDDEPTMALWMPGGKGRSVFTADAPQNRAIRNKLPSEFSKIPMPTVIVRQQGPAWEQPFVAVYEPFDAAEREAAVTSVEHEVKGDTVVATVAGTLTSGTFRAVLFQDANGKGTTETGNVSFEGNFGLAVYDEDELSRLYLGHGRSLNVDGFRVVATEEEPTDVTLWRDNDGWRYSATGDVLVRTPDADAAVRLPAAKDAPVGKSTP